MVLAWLVKMCGCATNSSPGIRIRRSASVEPARRPSSCSAPYPISTDPRRTNRSAPSISPPIRFLTTLPSCPSTVRRPPAQSGRVRCSPRPDTVRGTNRTGRELADPAHGTGGRRSSSYAAVAEASNRLIVPFINTLQAIRKSSA